MRTLLIFLSSLLLVSSQICSDVYPSDCALNKNVICTSPSYATLVREVCRLTCGFCTNGGTSGGTGGTVVSGSNTGGSASGSISDPNPRNQAYRTAYLNTNAVF